MKERIFRLYGKVQSYVWGGHDFIPSLLGIQKEEGKTYAEYWMGAHPAAPSVIEIDGIKHTLFDKVKENPFIYTGAEVYEKFGELPYLLKVLDVKEMLSIQVHPTKKEAQKGFDAEEAAGVPMNASYRKYKDRNHKPEVMVALSEFWLLHGFKQHDELLQTLHEVPELNYLVSIFKKESYHGLYKNVMELPQQRVNEILLPLVKRELSKKGQLTKNKPGYWVNRLYEHGQEINDIDRGIFSIYFFNIVKVQPGEAVFQGAGIPHAYLEGQNIELMANSDNVLRGGLTPKHIDVPELMKHIKFEGIEPVVMNGTSINDIEKSYPCPVPDFAISAIELVEGKVYKSKSASAEIYLVVEGAVDIVDVNQHYKRGESFFVLPSTDVSFKASGMAVVYKAYVP